jgi:hypothetical protein
MRVFKAPVYDEVEYKCSDSSASSMFMNIGNAKISIGLSSTDNICNRLKEGKG